MRYMTTFLAVAALVALAGCSQQSGPTPAQHAEQVAAQKAQAQAAANKKLDMFHKLLAMQRPDLAVTVAEGIVSKYPHTKAAAAVAKQLPALKATAHATAEKRRLTALWLYQVSPMAGGTQTTAAIKPSKPTGTGIELVLRRQSAWGTSTYLYDHTKGAGFLCHKLCSIVMHFDGTQHVMKGYLPQGGEPAMFIKDNKRFVARLTKAKKVSMTVTVKGQGRQTLVFETGGFVPAKWLPLPKKK